MSLRTQSRTLAVLMTVLVAFSAANAQTTTIHLQESSESGVTTATCDDTYLVSTTQGSNTEMKPQVDSKWAAIAFKDMFTLIGETPGDVVVELATLSLVASSTAGSGQRVYCDRIITDWLANAAGTNESNVTSAYTDDANSTPWSGGGFSLANDADTSERAELETGTWVVSYNVFNDFDVTDMVQAMFSTGTNYGFTVHSDASEIKICSSEHTSRHHPKLTIEYSLVDPNMVALTVNSGSGSSNFYYEYDIAGIVANTAPTGQAFDQWVGDVNTVDDVMDSDTFLTMPAYDITIEATYDTAYALTVLSGTGGGDYVDGAVVSIDANIPTDYIFVEWVGEVTGVDDVNAASTTITTTAADETITATFLLVAVDLTVISGSGTATYIWNEVVPIEADAPVTGGYIFYKWVGDTADLDNIYDANTTVTMPLTDVTVTATYRVPGAYSLTIASGSGGGMYDASEVIDIIADPVMTGKAFYRWHGDYATIDDRYATNTTITMPAGSASITAGFTDLLPSWVHYKQIDPDPNQTAVVFDDVEMNFPTGADDAEQMEAEMGDDVSSGAVVLLGLADLFDRLPETDPNSGRDIFILSATLTFTTGNIVGDVTVACQRVLTDWLVNDPGDNQLNVNSDGSDLFGGIEWTSYP